MALHNCAFTPLEVNFQDVLDSHVESSSAFTPLYNEAEFADGTPPATSFDDLTSAVKSITFDYRPARSPGSPADEKWSPEGIPIPPGIDVQRLMGNSARILSRYFPLQTDANQFYELAVSSAGVELFVAAFWALRAEQVYSTYLDKSVFRIFLAVIFAYGEATLDIGMEEFLRTMNELDSLTPTLLQCLARCYVDFMMLQPGASDLIPALVTLALAEAICGIEDRAKETNLVRRRRDAALNNAAHFVIRHFSGGLGVYNRKLEEMDLTKPSLKYAALNVNGLSPLLASLEKVTPRPPQLIQYSVPTGVVKDVPDHKISHTSKSLCGSDHILKKIVIQEHFK